MPLALFLLTAELIRSSPFSNWSFHWLARLIWGNDSDAIRIGQLRIVQVFTFGLPVALCYGFAEQPIRFGLGVGAILLAGAFHSDQQMKVDPEYQSYTLNMFQERSFFGVLKVEQNGYTPDDGRTLIPRYNRLLHGTTLHGMQRPGDDEPLTYYHRTGPVGQT